MILSKTHFKSQSNADFKGYNPEESCFSNVNSDDVLLVSLLIVCVSSAMSQTQLKMERALELTPSLA